jgi:hypothetical protein
MRDGLKIKYRQAIVMKKSRERRNKIIASARRGRLRPIEQRKS